MSTTPSAIPPAIKAVLDRHGLRLWATDVPRIGTVECWLVRGRDTVYLTRYCDGHGVAVHAPIGGNSIADTAKALNDESWQSTP